MYNIYISISISRPLLTLPLPPLPPLLPLHNTVIPINVTLLPSVAWFGGLWVDDRERLGRYVCTLGKRITKRRWRSIHDSWSKNTFSFFFFLFFGGTIYLKRWNDSDILQQHREDGRVVMALRLGLTARSVVGNRVSSNLTLLNTVFFFLFSFFFPGSLVDTYSTMPKVYVIVFLVSKQICVGICIATRPPPRPRSNF